MQLTVNQLIVNTKYIIFEAIKSHGFYLFTAVLVLIGLTNFVFKTAPSSTIIHFCKTT